MDSLNGKTAVGMSGGMSGTAAGNNQTMKLPKTVFETAVGGNTTITEGMRLGILTAVMSPGRVGDILENSPREAGTLIRIRPGIPITRIPDSCPMQAAPKARREKLSQSR